ncbi:class I SAM-dependent methyltransferase [Nostoc sp. FACHB-152]|uniref:class I SAM-dependent methyltransferase n=1 Tax=unclassified Nostoc TaxID=2593658 RepID=UPI001687FD84|nr:MULTISPECIES: class I SAM-dependent methyltransferase [unclassified Nostoc]MBD2449559.1 class I SAM-dependent methyltransferase [Nostoc sp. FACHB-152]MBD2470892.1 class I SAM-dependent methyltransferase [Nostoc sp. FACHB-145]
MNKWYKQDLAFIHDDGFRDFALKSAPGILNILAENQINSGLVVDLGCGSGLLAEKLSQANYQVLGVDISESLIAIAQTRVPKAEFRVSSLFKTDIPPCNAVISIGECFSYLFDPDNNRQTLIQLFGRIYQALNPGGVLIFDIAQAGQVSPGKTTQKFTEGKDWIVLVEKEENPSQATLTRRIITFRKVGENYRRDDEIHRVKLYRSTQISTDLRNLGFRVQITRSYGSYHLPKGIVAFVARKPFSS